MKFEFEVGEIVTHKCYENERKHVRFFICERLSHECHGGVQRFYVCRIVGSEQIQHDPVRFAEIELCRIPPVEETIDKHLSAARNLCIAAQDYDKASMIVNLRDELRSRKEQASGQGN